MKQLLAAIALAIALAAPAQAHVQQGNGSETHRLKVRIAHDRGVIAAIDRAARSKGSMMFLTLREWNDRQRHARDLAEAQRAMSRLWLKAAFMCIHHHEGSWRDPNPPYYGGLQMDVQFQRTYGEWAYRKWGTADHWPVDVQIDVAISAYYSGRGFYPWPNTARYCGLL